MANADNIDSTRTALNLYWDYRTGIRTHEENASGVFQSFTEVEHQFYEERYGAHIAGQCARNAKTGHAKRNRSVEDLLNDPRFCPEETIYQIGKDGECPPPELLLRIVVEFMAELQQRYGEHVHILDWALHLDETSPHIHARQVFDIVNRYGENEPKQEKALEALGIPLPHPDKKPSKINNRKVTFDADCRGLLLEICKKHGLDVEEEAIYGGKASCEKNDYIIESQREKIAELEKANAAQAAKLAEVESCVADADALLTRVTEAAYAEAVQVVTEAACAESDKRNRALMDELITKAESPKSPMKKEQQEAVLAWLRRAKEKLSGGRQTVIDRVKASLADSAAKSKERIKAGIRPSITALLETLRNRQKDDRSPERKERN